ncbi:MAG: hypothetical protein RLY21_96 [Planctomycetota bacterium]|jgi:hypothetical protein
MSQFPPSSPHHPQTYPTASAVGGSNALAIVALVLAVVGLCVPGLGLIGIVLGIVALVRSGASARGLAIGAIVVGAMGIMISIALVGLTLPALAKARSNARMVRSEIHMQNILSGIWEAEFDGMTDGRADYNVEAQVEIDPNSWLAPTPIPPGVGTAYLLVAPDSKYFNSRMPRIPVIIENPKAFDRDRLQVTYADLSTVAMPRSDVMRIIEAYPGKIYNTDGTPWKP